MEKIQDVRFGGNTAIELAGIMLKAEMLEPFDIIVGNPGAKILCNIQVSPRWSKADFVALSFEELDRPEARFTGKNNDWSNFTCLWDVAIEHGEKRGYLPCPQDIGPYLFEQGTWDPNTLYWVAMKPNSDEWVWTIFPSGLTGKPIMRVGDAYEHFYMNMKPTSDGAIKKVKLIMMLPANK